MHTQNGETMHKTIPEKSDFLFVFLKEATMVDLLTATGKLFHTRGAAFWKVQSPNKVEVLLEISRG